MKMAFRCTCTPLSTQCETLRSGQGDAAPPLNPQLPAPLPGQRAVGAAIANRVAGALPADRFTVMAAARPPPARVAATDDGAEANVDRACTRH